MSVKVKVDLSGLNSKLSNSALIKARKAAQNDLHQAMEKYVPKREGYLRKESILSADGKSITYNMPYAKAQFYGFVNGSRVHNYTTPGTSRRWDLRVKGNKHDMENVQEAFINALKLDK